MQNNKRPEDMQRITTPALAEQFINEQIEAVRAQVGDKKVLLALSGGVDSSVVAALLIKAIGKQLVCVHVNHGLLRKGEPEQVIKVFRDEMDANLIYVDAVDRFLDKLAGVSDPESKRKIIGAEFIRVFEEEARKQEGIEFLAQGTIYPDILESGGVKAHHNVGGLPEDLQFELVEPVRLLFGEVRIPGQHAFGAADHPGFIQPFGQTLVLGHQRPHTLLAGADKTQRKRRLLAGKRTPQHEHPVLFQPGGQPVRLRPGAEQDDPRPAVRRLHGQIPAKFVRQRRVDHQQFAAVLAHGAAGFPRAGTADRPLAGPRKQGAQGVVVLTVACDQDTGHWAHLTFTPRRAVFQIRSKYCSIS